MITEILSNGVLSITAETQLECYALRMWCKENPLSAHNSSVLLRYGFQLPEVDSFESDGKTPIYTYKRSEK